jgi:predicted HAD superfamily Cof-like phosphohydrolase
VCTCTYVCVCIMCVCLLVIVWSAGCAEVEVVQRAGDGSRNTDPVTPRHLPVNWRNKNKKEIKGEISECIEKKKRTREGSKSNIV